MRQRIFVSVASYCDPELGPTLLDLMAKADHPEWLRIGVCWQHDTTVAEMPDAFLDPRVRVISVPYMESRGACWARGRIMETLYEDEEFFFQIDSHHRFVSHWDTKLKDQAARSGSRWPILTTYGTPYNPNTPQESWSQEPMRIVFDRFADEIPLTRPESIQPTVRPTRARFVSAHCLFAPGPLFVKYCPYPAELYFHGEEVSLAIYALAEGFELFTPGQLIMWHEYTREGRPKHWDHHADWWQRDVESREVVRKLILSDKGKAWEEWAGIDCEKHFVITSWDGR